MAQKHGGQELKLENRLAESRSPYVSLLLCELSSGGMGTCDADMMGHQVRGHMNNPVAWQMWGPEAIALAKKHNRLLFVSIGYAACHCKVPGHSLFDEMASRPSRTNGLQGVM